MFLLYEKAVRITPPLTISEKEIIHSCNLIIKSLDSLKINVNKFLINNNPYNNIYRVDYIFYYVLERNENILDKIYKFESMINDDESFLDLDEVEDIILYYLNEDNFDYAEKAICYGIDLYPESLNIIILKSEFLLTTNKINEAELVTKFIKSHKNNSDLIFQKAKILTSNKKYKQSIKILTNLSYDSN